MLPPQPANFESGSLSVGGATRMHGEAVGLPRLAIIIAIMGVEAPGGVPARVGGPPLPLAAFLLIKGEADRAAIMYRPRSAQPALAISLLAGFPIAGSFPSLPLGRAGGGPAGGKEPQLRVRHLD